jgi:hypothetical protein
MFWLLYNLVVCGVFGGFSCLLIDTRRYHARPAANVVVLQQVSQYKCIGKQRTIESSLNEKRYFLLFLFLKDLFSL